ncbi:monooxygenase [Caenispirillum salinarum]|uniref:monooxygenase n=1 Tax=Caenispirillum salinarum TaxID=859058 RepID=UPI00384E7338
MSETAPVILQMDFPFSGPWGEEMAAQLEGLARDIAAEPGLIWKVWTENAEAGRAGGIYAFETEEQAHAYLTKHTNRLAEFGITGVEAKVFRANTALSAFTHMPFTASPGA